MIGAGAAERADQHQPCRAAFDRLFDRQFAIGEILLGRERHPRRGRVCFGQLGGRGIEISDPDFRQKAEGLRMPHTAIGRNRPRASGQFHDTVVNLEGTAEQDGKCGI
jgi:hypothetical protein